MSTPTPEAPWYQFSLSSLLLFTLFAAIICSLAVGVDWVVAVVVLEAVVIGGLAGITAAGSRQGFVEGIAVAVYLILLAAVIGGIFFVCALVDQFFSFANAPHWYRLWRLMTIVICGTAALIGGTLGGLSERQRLRR